MTHLIEFAGSLINPDQIYRIDRVTDTVTFTLLVAGLPAGNLQTDDFVFGSEALAITALDDFTAEVDHGLLTLAEAVEAVTAGVLSNESITTGALKNTNLGDIDERIQTLVSAVISTAIELKAQTDAVP